MSIVFLWFRPARYLFTGPMWRRRLASWWLPYRYGGSWTANEELADALMDLPDEDVPRSVAPHQERDL